MAPFTQPNFPVWPAPHPSLSPIQKLILPHTHRSLEMSVFMMHRAGVWGRVLRGRRRRIEVRLSFLLLLLLAAARQSDANFLILIHVITAPIHPHPKPIGMDPAQPRTRSSCLLAHCCVEPCHSKFRDGIHRFAINDILA